MSSWASSPALAENTQNTWLYYHSILMISWASSPVLADCRHITWLYYNSGHLVNPEQDQRSRINIKAEYKVSGIQKWIPTSSSSSSSSSGVSWRDKAYIYILLVDLNVNWIQGLNPDCDCGRRSIGHWVPWKELHISTWVLGDPGRIRGLWVSPGLWHEKSGVSRGHLYILLR